MKCRGLLPVQFLNASGPAPCPACSVLSEVQVFPALFRAFAPAHAGETVMEDVEAGCFYHPLKKAVVPCAACGRFLCALCDCELHGQHLCPACLEAGRKKGKIKSLENRRVLYDSIAIALTLVPLLIFWFTIVTAPLALFIAIRHWNTPTSIIHRTKIRFILAIVLASLEIVWWIVFFFFFKSFLRF